MSDTVNARRAEVAREIRRRRKDMVADKPLISSGTMAAVSKASMFSACLFLAAMAAFVIGGVIGLIAGSHGENVAVIFALAFGALACAVGLMLFGLQCGDRERELRQQERMREFDKKVLFGLLCNS